jgi:hypothetical protein
MPTNLYDNLYHPIDEVMAFNGSPNPNHDTLIPITESPAVTNRNVNFKINGDDDSNTRICNFNFGEKENPYPRFNAGIDDIATKKSLRSTTYAPAPSAYVQNTSPATYRVHPDTNQVHPVYAPASATLPHAPVHTQVHPAYLPMLMLILNHHCTRKVVQMSFRNHIPKTFDLTDQVQLPTRTMMKHFNEVL